MNMTCLNSTHSDVALPPRDIMDAWAARALSLYCPEAQLFHPAADAPSSWAELKAWADTHTLGVDSLPIFDGGCDNSIYTPSGNLTARAWHDATHLREKLGFTLADETAVGQFQCETLKWARAPYAVVRAVEADVVGQIRYYTNHKRYVDDQVQFVWACLASSVDEVIESGVIY